jgi:7-cyano-7-deazaguanine synthase
MPDSIAIISGGMDSVTLLHFLVKRQGCHPAVLTFTYGQKHSKELACAQYQADLLGCDLHLVDLSALVPAFESSALVSQAIVIPTIATVQGDPQPPTYVPNRNMIFLSIAAAYAETVGVDKVYYGAQSHDLYGYWDTTPEFVERLNAVFQLNRKTPVQVSAPLVHHFKAEVLRLGLELRVDYSMTWSCYAGGEKACGTCPTCAERVQAFREVGIPDPVPYDSRFVHF